MAGERPAGGRRTQDTAGQVGNIRGKQQHQQQHPLHTASKHTRLSDAQRLAAHHALQPRRLLGLRRQAGAHLCRLPALVAAAAAALRVVLAGLSKEVGQRVGDCREAGKQGKRGG